MTCPRCKTDHVPIIRFTKPDPNGSQDHWFECSTCHYRGGNASTVDRARDLWKAYTLPDADLASLATSTASLQQALALWPQVFGLIVCRNKHSTDQEKVSRFWRLMNQLTGLSTAEQQTEPLPEVPIIVTGRVDMSPPPP